MQFRVGKKNHFQKLRGVNHILNIEVDGVLRAATTMPSYLSTFRKEAKWNPVRDRRLRTLKTSPLSSPPLSPPTPSTNVRTAPISSPIRHRKSYIKPWPADPPPPLPLSLIYLIPTPTLADPDQRPQRAQCLGRSKRAVRRRGDDCGCVFSDLACGRERGEWVGGGVGGDGAWGEGGVRGGGRWVGGCW